MSEPVHENKKGEMSMYEMLSEVLGARGWQVERGEREELISTEPGSPVQCVDGRKDMNVPESYFYGPKIQGATAGVAAMIARMEGADQITDIHIEEACSRIENAGYKPGLHDVSEEHLHCGRVAKSAQLGDPEWGIGLNEVANIVGRHGGPNTQLGGHHQETFVGINFVPDTTRVPNPDQQSFQLDAWFAQALGLNLELVLNDAALTVEALNGPKIARIWE